MRPGARDRASSSSSAADDDHDPRDHSARCLPPEDVPCAGGRPPRSFASVRRPAAARSVPFSTAWEMKISPEALTRSSSSRLRSSSPSSRKHTTEKGRGAHSSQPGSAATQRSNSDASSTPRRMCACSPLRPWQRSTAHSFSARNRRPSAGPYSLSDSASSASGVRRYSGTRLNAAPEVLGPPRPEQRAVHRREHPLVRVDDERVGPLDALERPPVLGAHHRRAGVRGVDVQPRPSRLARVGDRRHRIDRRSVAVVPTVATTAAASDRSPSSSAPHPELVVAGHLAQPHPEHPRRLLDRRVRLLGAHDQVAAGRLAGRDQRRERRGRRGVLDVPVPARRAARAARRPSRAPRPRARSTAGAVRHRIATELSVAASSSARIAGSDELVAK